jgi:hypothetical protein
VGVCLGLYSGYADADGDERQSSLLLKEHMYKNEMKHAAEHYGFTR